MSRRVANLLAIWQAEGIRVERHGFRFAVIGLERPDWWPGFCERHWPDLCELLPDLDAPPAPEPVQERVPLPEDRQWRYNVLSAPVGRERLPEPSSAGRRDMLGKIRALEALAEYGLL